MPKVETRATDAVVERAVRIALMVSVSLTVIAGVYFGLLYVIAR